MILIPVAFIFKKLILKNFKNIINLINYNLKLLLFKIYSSLYFFISAILRFFILSGSNTQNSFINSKSLNLAFKFFTNLDKKFFKFVQFQLLVIILFYLNLIECFEIPNQNSFQKEILLNMHLSGFDSQIIKDQKL